MYYGNRKSKPKQKESQQQPQRSPRILGLGLIKLDFYLNLNDDLIKKYKLDFSKINSPRDLAFIAEDPTLLDLIQISSSDTLSNILLYINKTSINKSFVELITLSSLKIHPDEEHMKKIFTHVTEHNYLFSNEMSCTTVPNKISFAFKNGKKLLKYFDIITDYDPYIEEINNDMSNKKYLLNDEKSVKLTHNDIKEVHEMHEQSKRKTEKSKYSKSNQGLNDDNHYSYTNAQNPQSNVSHSNANMANLGNSNVNNSKSGYYSKSDNMDRDLSKSRAIAAQDKMGVYDEDDSKLFKFYLIFCLFLNLFYFF